MLLRLLNDLIRLRKKDDAHALGAAPDTAPPPALDHGPVDAWLQRGRGLEQAGALAAALDCYRACAAAHPDAVNAHLAAASALAQLWRVEECLEALGRAHAAAPNSAEIYSDYLLWNHLTADPDPRTLFERHRAYGELMAGFVPPRYAGRHRGAPDPNRRLRIGYVSRNFLRHSVAFFIEPVIAHHDRGRFEVYCYYTHAISDETTGRIAKLADVWRHVPEDDDETLARRIYDDAIDVLVDLGGHTKANRLGVFARQPAPVQITWLGYPDTTGVTAIGYRITDAVADPAPHAAALHTERLLRVGPPFLCYAPPRDSPPVTPRDPAVPVVFGSFNMLAKLNVRAIELWAQILTQVRGSRIVLKSSPLAHAETADRVLQAFAGHGIESDRLELRGWATERADHLAGYGGIDVALDTFPYNGTTTTCEALWMGVPVVTLAGETHMARVGASLLRAAGLPELVAANAAEYVDIAVALASDAARRVTLRSEMRCRLQASPLFDHAGFVRALESKLTQAWGAWSAAQPPARGLSADTSGEPPVPY